MLLNNVASFSPSIRTEKHAQIMLMRVPEPIVSDLHLVFNESPLMLYFILFAAVLWIRIRIRDPDPYRTRIQPGQRIRTRIRVRNPDPGPDPGGQN